MGIKPNFSRDDLRKRYNKFLRVIEKRQFERLKRLGEMCLIEARQRRGYTDQTGALNSSTGYQIYRDGVAVHSQFDAASGAESNAAERGINSGQTLAEKIGKQTEGYALIVVAGMNYAAYVEARGYNVLASAENLAKRELPRMLQKLIDNINRAAE